MRYGLCVGARVFVVLLIIGLPASQVFAGPGIGLPLHPNAIQSSVKRQSGKGEGTQWIRVAFRTKAPYEEVVKYYREKAKLKVQISQTDSERFQNTLILFHSGRGDQTTVNISIEVGKKVTDVEISRTLLGQ